jgi:hypothetical protein
MSPATTPGWSTSLYRENCSFFIKVWWFRRANIEILFNTAHFMVGNQSIDSVVLFATSNNPAVDLVGALYVATSEEQFLKHFYRGKQKAAAAVRSQCAKIREEYATHLGGRDAAIASVITTPLIPAYMSDIALLGSPLHFAGVAHSTDHVQELIQHALDAYLVQEGIRTGIDYFAQIFFDADDFDGALRHDYVDTPLWTDFDVKAKTAPALLAPLVPSRSEMVTRAEQAAGIMYEEPMKRSNANAMCNLLEQLKAKRESYQ